MPELRQQQNTLIYYCELASSEIDAVERRLIAEINPPMNGAIERAARGYRNITPLAAKYGSPGRPIESPSGKRRESVTVRIDPDLKAKALAHGLKLGPLLEEAIVAALQ
jgi:hypothetical protein